WISSRRRERRRSSCAGVVGATPPDRFRGDSDERLLPPVDVLLAGDLFSFEVKKMLPYKTETTCGPMIYRAEALL
ncbi:unnamed protein product, partial [Urochloa humidicola]